MPVATETAIDAVSKNNVEAAKRTIGGNGGTGSALAVRTRQAVAASPKAALYTVTGKTIDETFHGKSTFIRPSFEFATYDSLHSWWTLLPGWSRLSIRVAIALEGLMFVNAWTFLGSGGLLVQTFSVVFGLAFLGLGGYLGFQLIPWVKHRRVFVKPLRLAALGAMGADAAKEIKERSAVHVPRNFDKDSSHGVFVRIPLKDPLTDAKKTQLTKLVGDKLGITELSVDWKHVGSKPYVVFKPQPQPPGKLLWAEIRDQAAQVITKSNGDKVMIGLGRGGTPAIIDLENDSPHIGISAGSGAGKSVLIKTLITQQLALGNETVILDVKRVSHNWAKGLPGVKYLRDAVDIHDYLVDIAENELPDRNACVDRDEDPGRRLFIVVEEVNALRFQLSMHWRNLQQLGIADKGQSPAVSALLQILCMGRQVKIHVIIAGQSLTARSIGGPEARENLGIRLLSRYTSQMWNMLCAEVKPMPRKSRVKGRWQLVFGGDAHETQVAYMEDYEARELVMSSDNQGFVHASSWVEGVKRDEQPAPRLFATSAIGETDVLGVLATSTNAPDYGKQVVHVLASTPRELVTLEEALERVPNLSPNLNALRQLVKNRDSNGFPHEVRGEKRGQAYVYDLNDIKQWHARR